MDVERLPPWDALPYFTLPQEHTVFATTPGTLLLEADPTRVLMIVSCSASTGTFTITTIPDLANSSFGLTVNLAVQPLILTYEQHGPIVCGAWYIANVNAGLLTTITQSLSVQPKSGQDLVAALGNRPKSAPAPRTAGRLAQLWARLTGRQV